MTLCAGLSASLQAGVSNSVSYRIPAQTVEAGGGRSASQHYSQDGNFGSVGGVSAQVSPAGSVVKHGYVAQLHDVLALTITSATGEIMESSSGHLRAWWQMDDGSFISLMPDAVTWAVLTGPVSAVDAAGQFTSETLFADASASIYARLSDLEGTLHFTVKNVNSDDFGSYAGDGLPDDWQVLYFGLENASGGPEADGDGDGYLNGWEYLAGTAPNDPQSYFKLKLVRPDRETPALLEWSSLTGRFYEVQASGTLQTDSWETVATLPGTGTTIQWADPRPSIGKPGFYRVQVRF